VSRVLIIDDEPGIRDILQECLKDEGHAVRVAEDGFAGLAILDSEPVDVVLLDVRLPNMGGIDVLAAIREKHPDTETIMISGHANIDIAVHAVKIGAFDFLEKPLDLHKTATTVANAARLRSLRNENQALKASLFMDDRMVGSSAPMQRVRELIAQSAASDSRILILGPNGTGKELVAREIHRQSRRAAGPFVEVNCAAIPESLIESELFGHEKGAFTHAVAARRGKFELANGGTLFLDEIADMSLTTQAKVLRATQELKFERIGSEESISVDVRIVAATNKDIEEEVRTGRFREDLYFRLAVIPIRVPALRERLDDLTELVAYFMDKHKHPEHGAVKRLDEAAMEELAAYSWPGNIRELKNFIERINIMVAEETISREHVTRFLGKRNPDVEDSTLGRYASMTLAAAREDFEKELIQAKLRENGNNITRTAEALGLYPSSLHSRIRKYGITVGRTS
jgi:two-component system, NtrC family, nitrogen regulation response regulator NtrX